VPGSGLVKAQAEREGLHEIFKAADSSGASRAGSMCLAMKPPTVWSRASAARRPATAISRGRQGAAAARTWFHRDGRGPRDERAFR